MERPAVHVAKYSRANGGTNGETLYMVEVLFSDDTWTSVAHFFDLPSAQEAARREAIARNAELLAECSWPNRKVNAD
jgi:hypothetical protein